MINKGKTFSEREDDLIIKLAQEGNEQAQRYLLQEYRYLVRARARAFFLKGAEYEDLLQEGFIGFLKAIRDYKTEIGCSFRYFAEICVTRQLITAVKTANRYKHYALNDYVSLHGCLYGDDSNITFLDVLEDTSSHDPTGLMLVKDELDVTRELIEEKLTKMERDVILEYLLGKTYKEIAATLGIKIKAVDSAVFRAKSKLRSLRNSAPITCGS